MGVVPAEVDPGVEAVVAAAVDAVVDAAVPVVAGDWVPFDVPAGAQAVSITAAIATIDKTNQ